MIENKYDLVMCDLGNVLVNFDHRIAVKKILSCTPKKEEDIYDLFFDSGLTELYEEGKISYDEFFNRVRTTLDLKVDKDAFRLIWNDIFFEVPLNLKMHDFLKGIKEKYKLVMISNLNESHFAFLEKKMSIFKIFHKLVLSYEAGCRKPCPDIYKKALEFGNTIPSRAFYIDDRHDLIEAASRLGINGVVFDGETALRKIKEELDR